MSIATALGPRRWQRLAPELRRLAVGGAWFFVILSLVQLAGAVARSFIDLGGVTSFAATTGDAYHAPGLTFSGLPGLLLALVELGVVATAAFVTVFGGRRRARLAHLALIAWAALWMAAFLKVASVEPGVATIGRAALMTVLLGGTLFRALRPAPPGAARATLRERLRSLAAFAKARLRRLAGRARPAARRGAEGAMAVARRGWSAARPTLRSGGRRAAAAGRTVVRHLRESAVIPGKAAAATSDRGPAAGPD